MPMSMFVCISVCSIDVLFVCASGYVCLHVWICIYICRCAGVGETAVVSTLARHSWLEFFEQCATQECVRRREQSLVAEWKLLCDGHTAGYGHIGMVSASVHVCVCVFIPGD